MRDHALEQTTAAALAADPGVDDDTIAVEGFDGGHVVMRGSVASPAKRTHALRTAFAVAGVRDVDDQLRPQALGVGHRQDSRTEAAVLKAFIADQHFPAETMHVRAADGTVTLHGRVDLADQRDRAEEVARRVPGVSQLRNNLSVWMAASPNEVLQRVADAIGDDGADQLTVTVRDNVATLSGTVRSAADRHAAIDAAAGAHLVVDVEDEVRVVAGSRSS
jgi:osmotically-inducible protein OsmY